MKHEWRKHEKALYGAGKTPELLNVPAQKFIVISGRGDPNGADFSARISALYPLACALRSIFKARDEDYASRTPPRRPSSPKRWTKRGARSPLPCWTRCALRP